MSEITKIYKPWVVQSGGYTGGKSIGEIKTKAKKIHKLSSNENLLGSSPKAVQAIHDSICDINIYPEGTPRRLQESLAIYYDNIFSPDQFIIGNGGSEILDLTVRAFMEQDTNCIVSSPCFMPYIMFSGWSGGTVINVPLKPNDYSVDIHGILDAINDKTRIIFLTSPNNPTGTYINSSDLKYLIDHLPWHVVLVYDEVYHHFADEQDYTTALPYVQEGKNIIAINSFSKTYGLAALRLGYAYTTPSISKYIHKLCKPFYINSININVGIAALSDSAFVENTVKHVITERQRIYVLFEKLGIWFWPSQANFIMIKSPMPVDEFIDQMNNKGVMTRAAFGTTDCVRITIGTIESNNAMIQAIREVLIEQ